ncbi:MAG: hypothetical protein LUQ37_02435 [Methanoregulaceae archaeon]|jgi:hypothetical protein|nr:hypothetical protein [Methanoregulaceae archaeon]
MRREIIFIILIVVGISFSGCSMLGGSKASGTSQGTVKQSGASVKATGTTVAHYTMNQTYSRGDIVKEFDYDRIGKVVLDYDPKTDSYKYASVIYDEFGRLFYLDSSGTESSKRDIFETKYPFKGGHVENPDTLGIMKREYKEKYKAGQIVSKKDNSYEGVLILRYDYSNDQYTYTPASKQYGQWSYDLNEKNTDSRTSLESRYTKSESTVKLI